MATASVSQMKVLNALRKATALSINFDPRTIILTPHTRVRTGSGGYRLVSGKPRAPQKFNLESQPINLSGGYTGGEGGSVREFGYILVGLYDAQVEIDDTWIDGNTTYRVTAIDPKNDYEKRCVVTAFGKDPNYGG
jgi:hypothetical protein